MIPTIRLIGEINEESYLHLSTQLAKHEADKAVTMAIIELCSEGGSSYDGLAMAGRISTSTLYIIVKAYGKVMSAATAVLAAGDYRFCSPETWIMVHDTSDKMRGQVNDFKRRVDQLEAEEQQWAELLAANSDCPSQDWRKMSKKTTYLTAKNALQLGLVDEILKGKNFK